MVGFPRSLSSIALRNVAKRELGSLVPRVRRERERERESLGSESGDQDPREAERGGWVTGRFLARPHFWGKGKGEPPSITSGA